MTDLYTENITLNMRFEGTNNSTTFVDDCEQVFITNGNAKLSNAKQKYGTTSGFFDGNGSYLYLAGNNIFNLSSDDFTIEAYVNLIAMPTSDAWPSNYSNHMVICETGSPNASDGFAFFMGTTKLFLMSNDPVIFSATHNMVINTWYHVAVTRQANTMYMFVNGTLIGTDTWAGTCGTGSETYIGCETGQGAWFNGYIDELRVTRKIARYTSSFTPIQIDTLSRLQFSPELYNSNVVLNLRMDGNNGSNVFYDDTNLNSISVSNAILSNVQSKYGTVSGYFNGSSYLQLTANSGLDLSTSDFTIEFWCYCNDSPNSYPSYITSGTTWVSGSFVIRFDDTRYPSKFVVAWNPLGDTFLLTPTTFSYNQWRHVAVARDGKLVRLFIDGVIQATNTVTVSQTLNLAFGGYMRIGYNYLDVTNGYITDYMDEVRITKGVCRYKRNFIPNRIGGYKTISGVVNSSSGMSVANVLVRLYSNTDGNLIKSTYSNFDGTFTFTGMWTGDYYITCHYDDYPNIILNKKVSIA